MKRLWRVRHKCCSSYLCVKSAFSMNIKVLFFFDMSFFFHSYFFSFNNSFMRDNFMINVTQIVGEILQSRILFICYLQGLSWILSVVKHRACIEIKRGTINVLTVPCHPYLDNMSFRKNLVTHLWMIILFIQLRTILLKI